METAEEIMLRMEMGGSDGKSRKDQTTNFIWCKIWEYRKKVIVVFKPSGENLPSKPFLSFAFWDSICRGLGIGHHLLHIRHHCLLLSLRLRCNLLLKMGVHLFLFDHFSPCFVLCHILLYTTYLSHQWSMNMRNDSTASNSSLDQGIQL
jgi:hypothetical protein